MIVRTWSGWTHRDDENAYEQYMREVALPGYTAIDGNQGVLMLKRPVGDRTEFLMVSLWDSIQSVEAFAGSEPAKAVFYPEDERYLVARDERVRHYEVVFQVEEATP